LRLPMLQFALVLPPSPSYKLRLASKLPRLPLTYAVTSLHQIDKNRLAIATISHEEAPLAYIERDM
jgi:hypothetical protein